MRFHPLQYLCFAVYTVMAGGLLWCLVNVVESGNWLGTYALAFTVTIVLNCLIGFVVDGKSPLEILNPGKQSWAYMFGDPLCVAPALTVTSMAWGNPSVELPSFAYQTWWYWVAGALTVVLSVALAVGDNKRYTDNFAKNALLNPFKLYHTIVVVPVMIGTILMTAVPVIWALNWYSLAILVGLAVWGLLVYWDDQQRFVDPFDQYDLWNAFAFRHCKRAVYRKLRFLQQLERLTE